MVYLYWEKMGFYKVNELFSIVVIVYVVVVLLRFGYNVFWEWKWLRERLIWERFIILYFDNFFMGFFFFDVV